MLNIHLLRNMNMMKAKEAAAARMAAAKTPNLSKVKPGQQVTIAGFGKLSPAHRQHLQAYGVLPGRTVTVLAQSPVTILLVEQTELAFEQEIASQVLVSG